jgi:hypothetical protein
MLLSNISDIFYLVPNSLPDHSVQVLVLQITWHIHLAESKQLHCLLLHIPAAVSAVPSSDLPLSHRL